MIADSIIGGNTGKLYQSLVVEKQLASGVGYYYSGVSVADATISLNITPRDGISSTQIETAVNDVLNKIIKDGVTEDEVKRSISKLQDESVFEIDSLTGPAMMIGYQLASGLSIDQIESMAVDLEKVTSKDVQATVADYMLPNSPHYHAVVGHLIPQEQ
jgi:zinc protease